MYIIVYGGPCHNPWSPDAVGYYRVLISRKDIADVLKSVDQKPNVWAMISMGDGGVEDSQGDAKHSIQFHVPWLEYSASLSVGWTYCTRR